ncbi:MAG: hypothetical protein JXR73_15420 [Candidatus Omnitrophica bacterium]|nr:hypothetical protein [Candidatus Omnitrophota bacterium]
MIDQTSVMIPRQLASMYHRCKKRIFKDRSRRNGLLYTPSPRRARPAHFEAMESRILLSANDLIPGIVADVTAGLDAWGDQIQELIDNDSHFGEYVPGVLDFDPESQEQFVPTMRELLEAEVDIDEDGEVESDFVESTLNDIDNAGDGGGEVEFGEYYHQYFVDPVHDWLEAYFPHGSDDADKLNNFLYEFGIYLESDPPFPFPYDYDDLDQEPQNIFISLTPTLDMEVSLDDSRIVSNELQWDIDFSLTFKEDFTIDLGAQADELEIAFPDENTKIDLHSTVAFSITIGMDVDEAEFYLIPLSELDIHVKTPDDNLTNTEINIGFLGAKTGSDANQNYYSLNMPVKSVVKDPSDPKALGFENVPASSSVGVIIADESPDSFVLEHDVDFLLTLGDHDFEAEKIEVTEESTQEHVEGSLTIPENQTIDDLIEDIEDAVIAVNSDLAELLTIDEDGGKIRISLPATDSDLLGFDQDQYAADTLIASNDPVAFDFDDDVAFLVSLDGAVPYLIVLPETDSALDHLGFDPTATASLPDLTANQAPVFPVDPNFSLTITDGGGSTASVGIVLSSQTDITNLISAINAELAAKSFTKVIADKQDGKVVFKDDTPDSSLTSIQVSGGEEIGFDAVQISVLSLTGDNIDLPSAEDAHIDLYLDGGATPIKLTIDMSGAATPDSARDAINAALQNAGVSEIVAVHDGSKITLQLDESNPDADIDSFEIEIPKVTEGNASLNDLVKDIDRALDDLGITDIDALASGASIKLDATGHTLEIVNTLTLDADGKITTSDLEDVNYDELFSVIDPAGDPLAKFDVNLTIKADAGIYQTDGATPYRPEHILKVDINPFTDTVLEDTEGIDRLSFLITDDADDPLIQNLRSDPDSIIGFDEMLDFNVLGASEVIALISQLQGWLDRLQQTEWLTGFETPFTESALSDWLDLGDMIEDAMLMDDGDDGFQPTPDLPEGDIADIGKLLDYITINGSKSLAVTFVTAQDLANRLNNLGLLPDSKKVQYDAGKKQLTYDVSLEHTLADVQVPIDFNLNLEPLVDVFSDSTVRLLATGYLQASLGLIMGPEGVALETSTTLQEIYGDDHDRVISDNLAVTGAEDVSLISGRLTDDAHFDISIDQGGIITTAEVTVYAAPYSDNGTVISGANDNVTLDDLVDDINNSLKYAKDASSDATVDLTGLIEAAHDGQRIILKSINSNIDSFEIDSSSGDPAFNQLGLQPEKASTVYAAGERDAIVKLSHDAVLHFEINNSGLSKAVTISKSNTAENKSYADLLNDINAALDAANLEDLIYASREGNQIVFSAVDESVSTFKITPETSTSTAAIAVRELGFEAEQIAGVFLVGENDVLSPFGRLTADAEFKVKINDGSFVTVNIDADDTNGTNDANGNSKGDVGFDPDTAVANASIEDLVEDVNNALPGALSGKIVADYDGQKIILRAADDSVYKIEISADADDPAATEMGLSANQTVEPELMLIANNNAPSYFGPRAAANFDLEIGDGSFVGTHSISVGAEELIDNLEGTQSNRTNTLDNQSVFALVNDVNHVLEDAFSVDGLSDALLWSPIQALQDGNRLALRAVDSEIITGSDLTSFTLEGGASFDIVLNGGSPISISVDEVSSDNPDINDVVANVNLALFDALGGKVRAEANGNAIRFRTIDSSVVIDSVNGGDFGFDGTETAASDTISDFTIHIANGSDPAVTDLKLRPLDGPSVLSGAVDIDADNADLVIYTRDGGVYPVELDGAQNIGDIINAIENTIDASSGTTDKVTVEINGSALDLVELASDAVVLKAGAPSPTLTNGHTATFTIIVDNGTPVPVSVSAGGSDLSGVDLENAINTALSAKGLGAITASHVDGVLTLSSDFSDCKIITLTTEADDPTAAELGFKETQTAVFRVDTLHGSPSGLWLGLFAADSNLLDISEGVLPDGRIEGDSIGSEEIINRFFVRQVDSETDILSADAVISALPHLTEGVTPITFNFTSQANKARFNVSINEIGAQTVQLNSAFNNIHYLVNGPHGINEKLSQIDADPSDLDPDISGKLGDYIHAYVQGDKIVFEATDLAVNKFTITAEADNYFGLDASQTSVNGIEAEALFGFVGVSLTGNGKMEGEVGISLDDPSGDEEITLTDLLLALSDGDGDGLPDLDTVIKHPTFESPSGKIELEVSLSPDLSAIGLSSDAKIELAVENFGNPFTTDAVYLTGENSVISTYDLSEDAVFALRIDNGPEKTITVASGNNADSTELEGKINQALDMAGLADKLSASITGGHVQLTVLDEAIGVIALSAAADSTAVSELGFDTTQTSVNPKKAIINLTEFDLGSLAQFNEIDFSNILLVLKQAADFLSQYADQEYLDTEIPVIGVSLNDLLGVADRFTQAVEDIEQNPALTIQFVEQKMRETFGLPEGSSAFTLDIVEVDADLDSVLETLLRVDLHLPLSFSKALPIGFDLDYEAFRLEGEAGLGASGSLDVNLGLGVDLSDPQDVYLFHRNTGISGELNAAADTLTFNAAIGPLGVFIDEGNAEFGIDFDFAHQDGYDASQNNSTISLEDVSSIFDQFDPALTGSINLILPLYAPTPSNYLGDIGYEATLSLGSPTLQIEDTIKLPDLTGLNFDDFDLFNNLPLLIDAFDLFLDGVQDIMDGEIFGLSLPFIGDNLSGAADFIEDLQTGIIHPFRDWVENAPERLGELVQNFLFAALGPGDAGLENYDFGISDGLDILKNYDGSDLEDKTSYSDDDVDAAIHYWGLGSETENDDGTDFAQWDFRLGTSYEPDVDIDFDIGFPALGLESDANLGLNLDWELITGLGISLDDGAYLNISPDPENDGANPELIVNLDAYILPESILTGRLAFLQLEIKSRGDDFDGDANDNRLVEMGKVTEPSDGDPTMFHAEFSVDLIEKEASGDDAKKLSFTELGSLGVNLGLSADAEVNLDLTAKFNEDIIPDTVASLLPSINAQFVLDWHQDFLSDEGKNFDLADGLELVEFRDVDIDLGSFLGDTLGPFVEKIQEITGPIQPVIDIATMRIPVLSDLAGRKITLIDIAGMTGYVNPALIYAIADIITFVNKIPASPGELIIPLGDFNIFDKDAGSTAEFAEQLSSPNFNLSSDSDSFKINDFLPDDLDLNKVLGEIDNLIGGSSGQKKKDAELVKSVVSGSSGESGWAFPFLEDPSEIFGVLLGRPMTLVTYDLAPFSMEFRYRQSFPIWGPLFAVITGEAGFSIDFAFGYDTEGIARFIDSYNPLDLITGFFVSDTDLPKGTGGTDVPEVTASAGIFAGAEINLGVASAGVEGGIIATINFDLFDPNRDGKVRIDELVNTFLYEVRTGNPVLAPMAIFDIYGDVSAQLRAFIKFLFFEKTFNITPPITLFEFSIPFDREPILATERGDDALLLHIGPNSEARLNGNTNDFGETINVDYSGGEFEVWSNELGVPQSIAQEYSGNKIIVYGGEGDDIININVGNNAIPVEIYGGSGNDKITVTGDAIVTVFGDLGNDVIATGNGADVIYGGLGDDTITSGGGDDIIFGDTGSLRMADNGQKERIRSLVGDQDGADTIKSGGGNDIVFGGGGADTVYGDDDATLSGDPANDNDLIFGDGGRFDFDENGQIPHNSPTVDISKLKVSGLVGYDDKLFGNAGMDTILGGKGNDLIDGGAGDDQLLGDAGFDTIYGGSDQDDIWGGSEDDIIFGKRDPEATEYDDLDGSGDEPLESSPDGADNIYGEAGNDFIRGNAGADIVYGDRGADIIFGDEDDDTIYGEGDSDIIFGGKDSDIIVAGAGNDIVFGDDGLVGYFGFFTETPGSQYVDIGISGSRIRADGATGNKLIGDGDESLFDAFSGLDDGLELTRDVFITQVKDSDGDDIIAGGEGDDIVLGGAGNDWIGGDIPIIQTDEDGSPKIFSDGDIDLGGGDWVKLITELPDINPFGDDVLIGDGGGILQYQRQFRTIATIEDASHPGIDHIFGDNGADIAFGGTSGDVVYGGHRAALGAVEEELDENGDPIPGEYDDADILLGDNGRIDLFYGQVYAITATDQVENTGGADQMYGREDDDIILGGVNNGGSDELEGDDGDDVILGDNGVLEFGLGAVELIAENEATLELGELESDPYFYIKINDESAAKVTVPKADYEDMDALVAAIETALEAAEPIDGSASVDLSGIIDVGYSGQHITLSKIDGSVERFLVTTTSSGELGFDMRQTAPDLSKLDRIRSTPYDDLDNDPPTPAGGLGGVDIISGNAGQDVIIAGVGGDTVYGYDDDDSGIETDEADVILGDNGQIDLLTPQDKEGEIIVFGGAVERIATTDDDNDTGGGDTIRGNIGDDIILGGVNGASDGSDYLYGNEDDDVILGDNGVLLFNEDGDLSAVDRIYTSPYNLAQDALLGGVDYIYGNAGRDAAFGGVEGDFIYGDDDSAGAGALDLNDILVGDNGEILLSGRIIGKILILDSAVNYITTTDDEETSGAGDLIMGNAGSDILIGGVNDGGIDRLHGDADAPDADAPGLYDAGDTILGDNGLLDFDDGDGNLTTLDLIQTFDTGVLGAKDFILGNDGDDIAMGGTGGDVIYGDFYAEIDANGDVAGDILKSPAPGEDILMGDGGEIAYVNGDFNVIRTIETNQGGFDIVQGNDLSDIIMGGFDGDWLYGEAPFDDLDLVMDDEGASRGGDDWILGDNGRLDYMLSEDHVAGRPDIPDPVTLDNESNPDQSTLDRVTTTDPTDGGEDVIRGNAGDDAIFGGTNKDLIWGDTSDEHPDYNDGHDGDDLIFGDHGKIYPTVEMETLPGEAENPYYDPDLVNNNFFAIDTNKDDLGGDDVIFGNGGNDAILGQQGDDVMFGGTDSDIIIGGHNIAGQASESDAEQAHDELDDMDEALKHSITSGVLADKNPIAEHDMNDVMDGGGGDDIMTGDNAIVIRQADSVSPRYQLLRDGELYVMQEEDLGGLYPVDAGFLPDILSTPQRKPESDVGYTILLLDHSDAIQIDAAEQPSNPRVFGNDVMAGGSEDDEMFGQSGDDIMQGDGSIALVDDDDEVIEFDPSPDAPPLFTIYDDPSEPMTYFEIVDQERNEDLSDAQYEMRLLFSVEESESDGDDYMEGDGGNDRMYGDLGQDDMIGGASNLYGLNEEGLIFYSDSAAELASDLRPDGADLMYGGAGNPDRLARNDYLGSGTNNAPKDESLISLNNRHARDADSILGDNGNIYRLVEVVDSENHTEYLTFNYDAFYNGDIRIIPRAVELIDYEYEFAFDGTSVSAVFEGIGFGDLIYGESGDDSIHGMTGDDVIFGNSEDDDLYGEQGGDWISGGTGEDGILGDDGLIKTSRNDLNAEPLYGIAALNPDQGALKNNEDADPYALNAEVTTPGNIQRAVINVENELKKTIDLVAFNLENDDIPVNDIIYGGLNNDWIHAGDGDDAVLGGEALPLYYEARTYDAQGNLVQDYGFEQINELLQKQQNEAPDNPSDLTENPFWFAIAPYNPGDILVYDGKEIIDGNFKTGKTRQEFNLYDEFNPRRKIMLDANGEAVETEAEAVFDFLLNFDEAEGPDGYPYLGDNEVALPTDGDDRIFGDLGNDWIVGGTGRDHIYGGRGDDLLNMDDNHDSGAGGKVKPHDPPQDALDNTQSDEYQAYADIAYGGGGRDVLLMNTGADRAIDWVGEYNSYLVPFSPFGAFHISRTLQPQLPEFLYALSESDGLDVTVPDGARYVEQNAQDDRIDEPDPLRDGEPYGELGMVRQTDFDWQEQTGAPNDPQPGNYQGKREIMRRELFTDDSVTSHFSADAGEWSILNGAYQAAPEARGEEAVSIYHLDEMQPSYMEILATVNLDKAMKGYQSNAFIIFDYQSETDFKFAGVDAGLNKIRIGHRTEDGWIVDVQTNMQFKAKADLNLTLVMDGATATIWVNEDKHASFDFGNPLNDGYIGLGSDNSAARFDEFQVQKLTPDLTFSIPIDFSSAEENPFTPKLGDWRIDEKREEYEGDILPGGDLAISTLSLDVAPSSMLEMEAFIQTSDQAGLVFDYYNPRDFKFAAILENADQVVIGHYTENGAVIDAGVDYSIKSSQIYDLNASIINEKASIFIDGQEIVSYEFNSLITDGEIGLLTMDVAGLFDDFEVRGDDPAYLDNSGDEEGGISPASLSENHTDQTLFVFDDVNGALMDKECSDAIVAIQKLAITAAPSNHEVTLKPANVNADWMIKAAL